MRRVLNNVIMLISHRVVKLFRRRRLVMGCNPFRRWRANWRESQRANCGVILVELNIQTVLRWPRGGCDIGLFLALVISIGLALQAL